MAKGILIYAEQRGGELQNAAFEAIAAGQRLAAELGVEARVVLVGPNSAANAARVAAKELAEVITVEHEKLSGYTPDGYAAAMTALIGELDPEWTYRDGVAATCRGSVEDERALDAIERLRYAEEHAARREAGDLAPLRRRVRAIVDGQLGPNSPR